ERLVANVQKRMRHSGGNTRDVRAVSDEATFSNDVRDLAVQYHVRFFAVMHVKRWSALRMGLGQNEGRGFKSVLAAVNVIAGFPRHVIKAPHLIQFDDVVGAIKALGGWPIIALGRKRVWSDMDVPWPAAARCNQQRASTH